MPHVKHKSGGGDDEDEDDGDDDDHEEGDEEDDDDDNEMLDEVQGFHFMQVTELYVAYIYVCSGVEVG